MVKHHIDLFIERETKLLQEIKDYFENLIQGKYEHFSIRKLKTGECFLILNLNLD